MRRQRTWARRMIAIVFTVGLLGPGLQVLTLAPAHAGDEMQGSIQLLGPDQVVRDH